MWQKSICGSASNIIVPGIPLPDARSIGEAELEAATLALSVQPFALVSAKVPAIAQHWESGPAWTLGAERSCR